MALVSKGKRRKTAPGMTKNGKIKLRSLSYSKLVELLGKTTRPRDKDKITRFMNKMVKNCLHVQ